MKGILALALSVLFFTVSPSFAQDNDNSYWGVSVNFVPSWETPNAMMNLFSNFSSFNQDSSQIAGSEWSIGFVRGKDLSGDWGVSLVSRRFKNSVIDRSGEACPLINGQPICFSYGSTYVFTDVSAVGFEAHKYSPLVMIKDRVQIGVTLAAGLSRVNGTADFVTSNSFPVPETVIYEVSGNEAVSSFMGIKKFLPTGKVQLTTAVRAAPGLKIKVSGGVDFPGTNNFSIGAVYLFGAS